MPAFLPNELPVVARARHHWIVLLRKPSLILTIALVVLLLAAIFKPAPMAGLFAVVFGAAAFLRWQTWQAERIYVTRTRIVRLRGVPETTTTESSLRLDRISGAVLTQTVLGKVLNYGTIELEAPGNHPDFRRLVNVERPHEFYRRLRSVIFGDGVGIDPDDHPQEYETAPLPRSQPPRHRPR